MSTVTNATLANAVQLLTAYDEDRAAERNGVGFNKADSWIGHALAAMPQDTWGPETEHAAYVMLRKYAGQLAGAGIDYDLIPKPPAITVDDDTARDIARGAAYQHRLRQRRRANAPTVERVGDHYELRFEYDDEMVAGVRDIPARRWDNGKKTWYIGLPGAPALAVWAETFGAVMNDWTADLLAIDAEEGAELAAIEAAKPPRRIELNGETAVIFFPFVNDVKDDAKRLPGARFQRDPNRWEVPITQARAVVAFGERYGFWIDPAIVTAVETVTEALAAKVDASRALDAELEIPGIRDGLKLHPFQKAGIRYLLEHANGRGMIGDEMGLGKTPQTMCTVEVADAFPCLVVVPNLVKLNWLREIDLWLPGRSITLLDGPGVQRAATFRRHALAGGGRRTITTNDLTAEFIVVNYDILARVLERFVHLRLGAVIYDEAHYLKNPKAKRTVAAKKLATIAKLRLMATGTAILNRPIELASPLEILGRLGEFGGRSGYSKRYCNAHFDSLGHWDVSGASNLGELNRRLRETCYVRRDKRDVLTELPAVQRQSVLLPITNRPEYRRAEADVVAWATELAARDKAFLATLVGLDKDARRAAIERHQQDVGQRAESAESLRRMGALRKLTGEGKLAAVVEWTREFLEEEDKLILFAWHVPVQQALVDAFPGCARVMATDDPQRREREVERFQTDPECKLIVISLNVGGVGLTITAAHHLAFVELPWRPGDVDQAEGRAYGRMNDVHGLSSYYLLGEDTFDLDMADLIDSKREVTDAVNSGKAGASGGTIMAALVERMAERAAAA